MLQLFRFWECEEFFADSELAVSLFLCKAEVGDIEEAYGIVSIHSHGQHFRGGLCTDLLDRILQLRGKLLLPSWGVELGEIESDKISPVH